jgi:DNA topoisomerase VI subunit A
VGVSPDLVSEITAAAEVPYLLTIENLASFQRHVREIADNAVVIYTAGFPSPSLSKILQRLDEALPNECRFYHWGDRDVGGIRIFSHIEKQLNMHGLNPHLMSEESKDSIRFQEQYHRVIESYAQGNSQTASLAKLWLANSLGPMEQESLDPVVPS